MLAIMIFNIYCDIIKQTDVYILLDTFVKQLKTNNYDIRAIKQTRKKLKHIVKKHILLYPLFSNVIVCIDTFIHIIEDKNNENNEILDQNKSLIIQRKQLLNKINKLNNDIKKLTALKSIYGFDNSIRVFPA
jgi:hypothetical protein